MKKNKENSDARFVRKETDFWKKYFKSRSKNKKHPAQQAEGEKGKCPECGGLGSWYGVALHKHDMKLTGSIIGSTVLEPKETWPENFTPDPEEWGSGVWMCKACGGSGRDSY